MTIYDYAPEDVTEIRDEIKYYLHEVNKDVIDLGAYLRQARGLIPESGWAEWLDTNFHMSPKTARKFMVYAGILAKGADNLDDTFGK